MCPQNGRQSQHVSVWLVEQRPDAPMRLHELRDRPRSCGALRDARPAVVEYVQSLGVEVTNLGSIKTMTKPSAAPMPKTGGIIDLMIGCPFTDKAATYDKAVRGLKDSGSTDLSKPAGYMCKGGRTKSTQTRSTPTTSWVPSASCATPRPNTISRRSASSPRVVCPRCRSTIRRVPALRRGGRPRHPGADVLVSSVDSATGEHGGVAAR